MRPLGAATAPASACGVVVRVRLEQLLLFVSPPAAPLSAQSWGTAVSLCAKPWARCLSWMNHMALAATSPPRASVSPAGEQHSLVCVSKQTQVQWRVLGRKCSPKHEVQGSVRRFHGSLCFAWRLSCPGSWDAIHKLPQELGFHPRAAPGAGIPSMSCPAARWGEEGQTRQPGRQGQPQLLMGTSRWLFRKGALLPQLGESQSPSASPALAAPSVPPQGCAL